MGERVSLPREHPGPVRVRLNIMTGKAADYLGINVQVLALGEVINGQQFGDLYLAGFRDEATAREHIARQGYVLVE